MSEQFTEDEYWRVRATNYTYEGPIQPYVEIKCPACDTPNCLDYGVESAEVPFECVECEKLINMHVSIEVEE